MTHNCSNTQCPYNGTTTKRGELCDGCKRDLYNIVDANRPHTNSDKDKRREQWNKHKTKKERDNK